jgi:acetylornithine deacetylase/succinyl-diaminopimelate desuccinylase-like protein
MEKTKQKIDALLEKNVDFYIEELKRLCAQPCVSATSEGTPKMAELILETFNKFDFSIQKFDTPGNPIIVAKLKGETENTLLFFNHYDFHPPDPFEEWITPPFKPTIRDGALYARGAQDDKGELLSRLSAVKAVQEAHDGQLPCGVTSVVKGEEEIGSPHIARILVGFAELNQ